MASLKHRHIEEQERIAAYRAVAEEIAVRADILQRCEDCREVFDKLAIVHPGADLTPAYEIASAMIRDGDSLVEDVWDRKSLLAAIKAVCEDSPSECECMRRGDD
jgi:hypothetical protein